MQYRATRKIVINDREVKRWEVVEIADEEQAKHLLEIGSIVEVKEKEPEPATTAEAGEPAPTSNDDKPEQAPSKEEKPWIGNHTVKGNEK
jgi:hypothetical protein